MTLGRYDDVVAVDMHSREASHYVIKQASPHARRVHQSHCSASVREGTASLNAEAGYSLRLFRQRRLEEG